VAVDVVALAFAEGRVEEVGEFDRDVQKILLARRAVVRDGGLDHVAAAVQLVVVLEVGQPLVELVAQRVVGVDVAVGCWAAAILR
jgi:hypothetical protein